VQTCNLIIGSLPNALRWVTVLNFSVQDTSVCQLDCDV
jgi:hypothetical protein